MGGLSEMAKIRNLHWWTVEYGLIGTLENPKLYGAGLLSSIEESQLCLKKEVKKFLILLKLPKSILTLPTHNLNYLSFLTLQVLALF